MHQPALEELVSKIARVGVSPSVVKDDAAKAGAGLPSLDDLIVSESNGVALIPVHGVMVKRTRVFSGWFDTVRVVGVDFWAEMVEELTKRSDITDIVIDFDTGGGQVAGTERLANAIWNARQTKNVVGVANEFACSAGLWALSQCSRVVTTRTAGIGSLGVYMLHFDDTKFLSENWGIEKSVVYRGKYKASHERPLDKELRADMQRFIDSTYSEFIDAVARGRGVSANEVIDRWGEAQLFTGSEAVSNGLADDFGTLQEVLEELNAGRKSQVSVSDPPADSSPDEGDPSAMKLNATGQILDSAGKVVGSLNELELTASVLGTHCKAVVDEMIASAVKTATHANTETFKAELAGARKADQERLESLVAAVGADDGVQAFLAGQSIDQAKAGKADKLAAENETLRKQLADAQTKPQHAPAPSFASSERSKTGSDKSGTDKADPMKADWDANKEACQDTFIEFAHYKAYREYQESKES
ncbi:MAG: S49 family peptidase [Planctomyces sp.]|nr:S49 family peptidase [Planctomyces sp.]